MGLRSTIQNATLAAFAAIGDLAQSVEYHSMGSSKLDTTTGVIEKITVYMGVSGVKVDYTESEVDGENILPRDQKFLVAVSSVVFSPKAGDRLLIPNGTDLEKWGVVGREADPADALHILHIRRVQ